MKPLELVSSNVDRARDPSLVTFRRSNGGALMCMIYGFNWGVRNDFIAWQCGLITQTLLEFTMALTLSADVPYKCPLYSPLSINLPAKISASMRSRVINKYSRPGTSPGRIGRVVSVEIDAYAFLR